MESKISLFETHIFAWKTARRNTAPMFVKNTFSLD